ncbi:pseudaminic acid cytidylyltransferase [Magnetovibrio blakemorei]|uniref:pseudaminic acid cytidylyltransferase n=1 Tax=Magnetovibrio blakemorei TaxID=28181 RepID=UPI0024805F05|nr:pseudaminic acid cytidylyltransferase [Magnetovibrio blakemorei]
MPARGGSERIPQKNIKLFCGKPIIAYSITAALESQCFDRVIVSTDSPEVADVAQKYGAEVPFLRPAELADAHMSIGATLNHAINWLRENDRQPDYVCLLLATAPFVRPQTLRDAFSRLEENPSKFFCFGVVKFAAPIQRAFKISQQGTIEMFQPEHFASRSQDLEPAYHDAAQFCWGRVEGFLNNLPSFSEHSIAYILPSTEVQDIDTQEDWDKAEIMCRMREEA